MNSATQPDPAATVPVPARLARRPRDKHGRVVPWFVGYVDGQPDHRVVRPEGIRDAVRFGLCFLCGDHLGKHQTFIVGPMCVINRVSGEPPAHRDCAEYAVQACPFLTHPHMRRRDNLPENTVPPDGEMNPRNPGVCVTWTTRMWAKKPGLQLFTIGTPTDVTWWREGRHATYTEALAGFVTGLEFLKTKADEDPDPARAHESLLAQYEAALAHLPGNAE
ncbi:hypothetical protein ACFYSF_22820 [Streptomyces canus]|uniref:hypothetical protein n=1 Tax=Streptomyces canus TaxID=58343 RepID=UPI0036BBE334